MISQLNVSASTPMGATLVAGGGATFRAWAPRASAVYLNGTFKGVSQIGQISDLLLKKDANGYWAGFVKEAREGDLYHFWVVGAGGSGYKRDPYARELATDAAFPNCSCIIRAAAAYPWHDAGFVTPDFTNMIVYQVHIGTYPLRKSGPAASTFLDLIDKIPYIADLGANVLQPLPVDEVETDPSMGYDGADYFSPDFPYVCADAAALAQHLTAINKLLAAKGASPLSLSDIRSGHAQLKALVDLCHLYGIAVVFDVVYNHAGGFSVDGKPDDQCLYYWDRAVNRGNNNDSLYFTDQDRGTGGLSFALWNNDVRQFIINNASYYINEFHADGFRYDEISGLISMNGDSGWSFCHDLTGTVRALKPRILQNAEFWPGEVSNDPKSTSSIVTPVDDGGAGFDVVQHDGLRGALRAAIQSSSFGQQAGIDFGSIAGALYPQGFAHGWQTVTCVENHDIVKVGADQRIPSLADGHDSTSWYARSRARFAMGILLTAPGIPQLFMGQEFLEDKQWSWDPKSSNLLGWNKLDPPVDPARSSHLSFSKELIRLRWNQPALRGDKVNAFHLSDLNRVLAFHRWVEGSGQDVVVVATLSETNWFNYSVGFPYAGEWKEVFNSDVGLSATPTGNGGQIFASGPPLHGLAASAAIVIPANGVLVFARA